MPYDQSLAQRTRAELNKPPDLQEKKMFGGVAFLVQGNMACGVHGQALIVRVGPECYEQPFSQPNTRPFDMTGRLMSGWVTVAPKGYETESDLRSWVRQGVEFARSLPAK
ncbi:MAG: TfoX/Sxy family protein [Anaerolineales bacterium]|nr:TfoX/Sxy family protein [Anaerolineales bacterium]